MEIHYYTKRKLEFIGIFFLKWMGWKNLRNLNCPHYITKIH